MRGLKRIGVDQNPLALRTATASRRPFVLDAQISDPDLGLPFELDEARLEVNDLPTALELSANLAAGTVTYNAAQAIERVDFSALSTDAFTSTPITVNELAGTLSGVPAKFKLALTGDLASPAGIEVALADPATNGPLADPIDKIELMARSSGAPDVRGVLGGGADAADGAVVRALAGSSYVFARVRDLQKVGAKQSPFALHTETSGGNPFTLDTEVSAEAADALGLPFGLEADAQISNLPSTIDIVANLQSGVITYASSAEIAEITATAKTFSPFYAELGLSHVDALVRGLPQSLTLGLPAPGASSFGLTSTLAPIDLIELKTHSDDVTGVAPASLPDSGAIANSAGSGTDLKSFAFARVEQVSKLTAGLDPIKIDAEIGSQKPFSLAADLKNTVLTPIALKATAQISKLPTKVELTANPAAGTVTYNAAQAIERVDFSALSTDAFTSTPITVNELAGTLSGVPAKFKLALTGDLASPAGIEVALADPATNGPLADPIDKIELMARSSGAPDVRGVLGGGADAADGAVVRALAGSSYVFARVRDLQKVGAKQSPFALHTETSGGNPFTLDTEVSAEAADALGLPFGLEADAQISNLPSTIDIVANLQSGVITYASSAEIAEITATAKTFSPFYAELGLSHVDALVRGLPQSLTLGLPAPGASSFGLTSTLAPIDLIELKTHSDDVTGVAPASLPDSGAIANSAGSGTDLKSFAFARVEQVSKLTAGLDPIKIDAEIGSQKPFSLAADLKNTVLTPIALKATAQISKLPTKVELTANPAAGTVTYNAAQAIERVDFSALSTDAFTSTPITVNELAGTLSGVPAKFKLALTGDLASPAGIEVALADPATNGPLADPIDKIELMARSSGAPDVRGVLGGGADAADGAVVRALAGSSYVFARVRDLQKVGAKQSPFALHTETSGGNPFTLDTEVSAEAADALGLPFGLEADAQISNLPSTIDIVANLQSGVITYASSAEIAEITATAKTFSPFYAELGLSHVDALVRGLPQSLTLGLPAPGASSFGLTSTLAPIDLIELKTHSDDVTGVAPASLPDSGAIANSAGSGTDLKSFAFARVEQVSKLTAGLDPIKIDAEIGSQKPFSLAADLKNTVLTPIALKATAQISKLPTKVELTANLSNSKITYKGSSTIGSIDLLAEAHFSEHLVSDPVNIDVVDAHLEGIPKETSVGYTYAASSGRLEGFHLDIGNPLDLVQATLTTRGARFDPATAIGSEDGIVARVNTGAGASTYAFVRLHKLDDVGVSLDPARLVLNGGEGRRFMADAELRSSGVKQLGAEVDVRNLPSSVDVWVQKPNAANVPGGNLVRYRASSPIASLRAEVDNINSPVALPFQNARVVFESLPSEIDVSQSGSTIFYSASGYLDRVHFAERGMPFSLGGPNLASALVEIQRVPTAATIAMDNSGPSVTMSSPLGAIAVIADESLSTRDNYTAFGDGTNKLEISNTQNTVQAVIGDGGTQGEKGAVFVSATEIQSVSALTGGGSSRSTLSLTMTPNADLRDPVAADVTIYEGGSAALKQTNINASTSKLPETFTLKYPAPAADLDFDYSASATIDRVSVEVTSPSGGLPFTAARLVLVDVPTQVSLEKTGSTISYSSSSSITRVHFAERGLPLDLGGPGLASALLELQGVPTSANLTMTSNSVLLNMSSPLDALVISAHEWRDEYTRLGDGTTPIDVSRDKNSVTAVLGNGGGGAVSAQVFASVTALEDLTVANIPPITASLKMAADAELRKPIDLLVFAYEPAGLGFTETVASASVSQLPHTADISIGAGDPVGFVFNTSDAIESVDLKLNEKRKPFASGSDFILPVETSVELGNVDDFTACAGTGLACSGTQMKIGPGPQAPSTDLQAFAGSNWGGPTVSASILRGPEGAMSILLDLPPEKDTTGGGGLDLYAKVSDLKVALGKCTGDGCTGVTPERRVWGMINTGLQQVILKAETAAVRFEIGNEAHPARANRLFTLLDWSRHPQGLNKWDGALFCGGHFAMVDKAAGLDFTVGMSSFCNPPSGESQIETVWEP